MVKLAELTCHHDFDVRSSLIVDIDCMAIHFARTRHSSHHYLQKAQKKPAQGGFCVREVSVAPFYFQA